MHDGKVQVAFLSGGAKNPYICTENDRSSEPASHFDKLQFMIKLNGDSEKPISDASIGLTGRPSTSRPRDLSIRVAVQRHAILITFPVILTA